MDRRAFEHTLQVYNDDCARSLICFVCARICLDSGCAHSHIRYYDGAWLLQLPRGSLKKNFSSAVFEERYQRHGSPLAFRGHTQPHVDFQDWQLRWHPDLIAEGSVPDVLDMASVYILCCPEDHRCARDCVQARVLCQFCEVPICRSCRRSLQSNHIAPMSLINDNFYGYLDPWIWESNITWMEKTVATPFWTGMLLFSIDSRSEGRRKTHNLLDEAFQPKGRIFF